MTPRRRHIALLAPCAGCIAVAGAALAEPVAVPSGQPVEFVEVIQDTAGPAGATQRFRFLAPEISRSGDGVDFAKAAPDMEFLCTHFALPRLPADGPAPAQIIVSLSDRPVAFGEVAPGATQFFEAYRIEDGACIWEEF